MKREKTITANQTINNEMKKNKYPKYSVLMSVYYKETANNLKKSIESVINQTVKCDEFVLIEDGPLTDELDNLIVEYQKQYPTIFKVIKLEKNVGLGLALNKGVLECKNEIIARFDSDDISINTRCEKQLNEFSLDNNLDIVGSNHIEFIDDASNKKSYSYKNLPTSDEDIKKYARKRNPFSHSAVMFKKSRVLEAGNYRSYYYVEDYDLWVRMIQLGCKCKNIDEYLSYVKVSEDLYKRRGGLKYLKSLMKFKNEQLKNGFYSFGDYLKSSTAHIIVCLMPGSLRQFVYKKMLRK